MLKQFFQVNFQAARLIGLVATNGPLVERDFEIMDEDVEHEKRVAVFVEKVFGRFAIDGGDKGVVVFHEDGVEKLGEVVLKFFERDFGKNS